jgi:hypothetical protein
MEKLKRRDFMRVQRGQPDNVCRHVILAFKNLKNLKLNIKTESKSVKAITS